MSIETPIEAPSLADAIRATALAAPVRAAPPKPYLNIRPPVGWQPIDLAELRRFRELFGIFAARDIKVRYKQTVLGVAWALIQLLIFTVLGIVVFGGFDAAGTDGAKAAFRPPLQILLLPLAATWAFLAAVAIGLPLCALLPVTGPIDFFRWCTLRTAPHPSCGSSVVATLAAPAAGLAYFRRVEDSFADMA